MLSSLAVALLAGCVLVRADGLYAKNSAVVQLTGKTYDSLIAQSNHTSIVEFYAPWCGHCKSLQPAYEKAAKNLAGLAKVAAVNCDEEENKMFCGQMGVKGFPTLKIVKPGSKRGRPSVEDYQGPRTAKGIVDAVIDKIPNHVKKVQDSDLDSWLTDASSKAKAILFSDKGTISPLVKSLAIEFLGSINIAQIRDKQKKAVEKYGVTKYPTIVLIPGEDQEPITYEGEVKRESLIKFLSQIATPNPDPAPKKAKTTSKTAKSTKPAGCPASSKFSEASKAHKSSDYEDYIQGASTVILSDDMPTESPLPIVEHQEKPMVVKDAAPAIPQLASLADLQSACLRPKSGTCVLVLLPLQNPIPDSAIEALTSFAEVANKHTERKGNIFPFYGIPTDNLAGSKIRTTLGLKPDDLEILAVNKKRNWWRSYTADSYTVLDAENFVDAIRFGEGSKHKLPAEWLADDDSAAEAAASLERAEAEPAPEATAEPSAAVSEHDEL